MSWAFSVPPTEPEKFNEAAYEAMEKANIPNQNASAVDQAQYALDVASDIVDEGFLGEDGFYNASLSGHHAVDGANSIHIGVYFSKTKP